MPEIRASAFFWGRKPVRLSAVPMLASMGCPYRCDFCIDWSSTYRPLPAERLATDLRFLTRRLPGTLHEGRSTTLPRFYRRAGARVLGRYAELLSPADLIPDLSPAPADHQAAPPHPQEPRK